MKRCVELFRFKAIPIVLVAALVVWGVPALGLAQTTNCPTISASGAGIYSYPSTVIVGGSVLSTTGGSWQVTVSEGTTQFCSTTSPLSLAANVSTPLPDCMIDSLYIGTHTLSITLTDGTSTCTETVLVEISDDTAPTLAPEAKPSILWPPNNKLVSVVVTTNAADNSGAAPTVTASVVSSEPVKIVGRAKRNKITWDTPIYNSDGTITFNLPAQRLGKNKGRVYSITVTATDESKNSSDATIEVNVPHDQSKKKKK
ncbi:MAG: hypothetical protein AB9873_06670 [Syntrophobacteraceae bacterium]